MALIIGKYELRGEEFEMAYASLDPDFEDWVLSKDANATVTISTSGEGAEYKDLLIESPGKPDLYEYALFFNDYNQGLWVYYAFRTHPELIDYAFGANYSAPVSISGI